MRFAITLDLGHFVEGFPFVAFGDVGLIELGSVPLGFQGKHDTVGQVAVVGDRQHFTVGFFRIIGQVFPQIPGIRAAHGRLRGVWHHLPCTRRAVTHDHHAVHVVALDQGGPLKADKSCKAARIVEGLRIINDFFPQVLVEFRARRIKGKHLRIHFSLGESRDQVESCLDGGIASFAEPLAPASGLFVGQELRLAGGNIAYHSHTVGMVGHHQPVQGPRQPDELSGRGHHLFTACETVGFTRTEAVAEQGGIHGKRGVKVGIPPEWAFRESTSGIRRIGLAGVGFRKDFRRGATHVLCCGR